MKLGSEKEAEHLSETLAWACGMIVQSDPEDRRRISCAYRQAQEVVASIPLDGGDARPRIAACFERFDACRTVEDAAGVGWLLTAIQERVDEQNLPGWRELRSVVREALIPPHFLRDSMRVFPSFRT